MRQLVIEYVLEGHQRGYSFTSSTQGYTDAELKLIWRSAMPRGQGWSQYAGARSLKCFQLESQRRMVICETTVTDMRDENGRSGIRRTLVDVMPFADYGTYLEQRLHTLPENVRARVEKLPSLGQRLAIHNSLLTHKKNQLVLLHPYRNPHDWQVAEALVIKLALNPLASMRGWGPVIAFTTLALNPSEESPLVALPADKAAAVDRKTPTIKV